MKNLIPACKELVTSSENPFLYSVKLLLQEKICLIQLSIFVKLVIGNVDLSTNSKLVTTVNELSKVKTGSRQVFI